ncbi:XRE family transcriptional regulator [Neglecta sp. X4]|uniref:helix-turn-helix domain-containing protein n=1 Tax=unclassified Neglectibacter TaxID=2632164 RepID=UPI001368A2AC|nr:XRE family transcriptional regulator [Neglectibacter sp. 59]NBJ74362.1 XRE family transcriptional regulator [Neglectibacter sp. X4]NCE82126.1 XRE family transcriptional regulator [Neglectibacter sp. X58]
MQNLKSLRQEKGYSQLEMAGELGIPQSTYQQYEAGINEPKFSTLIQIADYFDVSIDYLIGRTNVREPWDKAGDRVIAELSSLRNPRAKEAILALLREIRQEDK